MRKTKEVVEEVSKGETDPAKLKLYAELIVIDEAKEKEIADKEAKNAQLSQIALDTLVNGSTATIPKDGAPIPPAVGPVKTFDDMIKEAIASKEAKK